MLLALVAGSSPLAAADGPLGPPAAFVLEGRDGDWLGELDDDYLMRNDGSRDGAVRYFFIDPPTTPGGTAGWSAAVEVELRPQNQCAFAGLLLDYRENPRRYLIFARLGDGRASLWQRSPEGIVVLAEGRTDRLAAELRVFVTGPRVILLVDDALFTELDPATIGPGPVGIVAGGPGSFGFSGFRRQRVFVQTPSDPTPETSEEAGPRRCPTRRQGSPSRPHHRRAQRRRHRASEPWVAAARRQRRRSARWAARPRTEPTARSGRAARAGNTVRRSAVRRRRR